MLMQTVVGELCCVIAVTIMLSRFIVSHAGRFRNIEVSLAKPFTSTWDTQSRRTQTMYVVRRTDLFSRQVRA